jgi:hypothetical protein
MRLVTFLLLSLVGVLTLGCFHLCTGMLHMSVEECLPHMVIAGMAIGIEKLFSMKRTLQGVLSQLQLAWLCVIAWLRWLVERFHHIVLLPLLERLAKWFRR